jgi:hypothetical protein
LVAANEHPPMFNPILLITLWNTFASPTHPARWSLMEAPRDGLRTRTQR